MSPSPFDSVINQESSLVGPTPPEIHRCESVLDQPLVVGSVELAPSTVHQLFSVESGSHTPHVLLVSLDSPDSEKDSPVPVVQETAPSAPVIEVAEDSIPDLIMEIEDDVPLVPVTPMEDHPDSMVTPPSSLIASFDWS